MTPMQDLKKLIKTLGSQAAAASHLGIKPAYLCDILHGRRGISENVADRLGWKQVWKKK